MANYKAAVIGLGNIGLMYDFEPQRPHPSSHVFAYNSLPMFDLVCGIDGDEGKQTVLRQVVPNAFFFTTIEEAINSGKLQNIDVVSICTPPKTHLEIIHKLLQQNIGKIIFCEKPIVSNLEEAKFLQEELESHKDVIIIPNISRRWNSGLARVSEVIQSNKFGAVEKINIRYTRGIENTGAHLFDLLKMWTGQSITKVYALSETQTSALPEPAYNFYFELDGGVTGYAEAVNDKNYYLFEIDLYLSKGKIEMRNSGDDIIYYRVSEHHLFNGFNELVVDRKDEKLLQDACMKNAIENIQNILMGNEKSKCSIFDAIYPLYVADSLKKSYTNKTMEEIKYV